jgi:hypothetical protein
MKRITIASLAILALVIAGCGGGDKPSGKPASTPAGIDVTAAPAAKTGDFDGTTSGSSSGALGDIFNTVFSSALGGGPSDDSAGEPDPGLADYLPPDSALPSGFEPVGQYTFRTPDGISGSGSMDIAAEMAVSGDIKSNDPTNLTMLMAMVIKPEDVQEFGEAFGQFKDADKDELEDALREGASGFSALEIADVKVLDADGLGQGGMGFQMTIDMSGLADMFGASIEDGPQIGKITLRMYMFAEGDYVGAVMRLAFSDQLSDDVDDVALARIIDNNLKKAP